MRIKFGIKAWSTLSAMLLSLAVVSGCNEEPASTPSPAPSVKAPEKKTAETPPPPTPPKAEEKK